MGCNKSNCGDCSCSPPTKPSGGAVEKHEWHTKPKVHKHSVASLYPPGQTKELSYPVKQVIILRSLPGANRAEVIKQYRSAKVVSFDEFFTRWGEVKFDSTKIDSARKFSINTFLRAIATNVQTIVVDDCNIYAYEISPYKFTAEAHDYVVTILNVPCDIDMAFKNQHYKLSKEAFEKLGRDMFDENIPWPMETYEEK